MTLRCDYDHDCKAPVTHVDSKGWLYCTAHGERRKAYQACRKLKPAELKRLEEGGTIRYAK